MDHYRIIEADYAFIGRKRDMAEVAPRAADRLRKEGLRVGLIMLDSWDEESLVMPETQESREITSLLAELLAVSVIEPERRETALSLPFAESLSWSLRLASESPDWPHSGRVPRVYSATLSRGCGLETPHLLELAKAMHVYAPTRMLLSAGGATAPVEYLEHSISA